MNEAFFTIFSASQSVSVQTEFISGSHDELFAYLQVPINFTLRTAEHTGFSMLPVNAQLFLQQPVQFLRKLSALGVHQRTAENLTRALF